MKHLPLSHTPHHHCLIQFNGRDKIMCSNNVLLGSHQIITGLNKAAVFNVKLSSHQIMFALNHHIQAVPIIPLYDPGLRNFCCWEHVFSSNPSLMTKYATKDCVTPNFQPLQNVANHQLKCFLRKFCLEICWAGMKITKKP